MTPGVHPLAPPEGVSQWVVGARAAQPFLKPAFALTASSESSMAYALFRCQRANARLRATLTVPASDPDHDYLRSW
eukprot:57216-Pleurochrysis_carterae.AAC.1